MEAGHQHLRRYQEAAHEILQLGIPIIMTQMGMFAMLLVDTYMVAQLGEAPLAGVGLGSLLFFTYFAVTVGILSAIDTLVSQAFGREDPEGVRLWFGQGVFWAIVLSVIGFVFLRGIGFHFENFGVQQGIADQASASCSSPCGTVPC